MEEQCEPASRRFLIVGNGMASHRLCRLLAAKNLSSIQITVIGEESRPAYDRVNLTRYFDIQNPDELILSTAEWYQANGIRLLRHTRVISVDRWKREIKTDTGEAFPYDQLILATGSKAFVPPIQGIDLPGVFTYRTLEDMEAIKQKAAAGGSAIVIGGGLLGLEAAYALLKLGMDTTVVEKANGLMPRQLNEEGSSVLIHKVATLGIRLKLKSAIERIQSNGNRLTACFQDGSTLVTDMVVFSAGIVPRDELARSAGLPVGARGGAIVNDHLQTEDPGIHAIGECASHRGVVYGFVSPCYQQAEILSEILTGNQAASYKGSDFSCRLKLFGIELSVYGDYLGDGAHHSFQKSDCYRMIVVKNGRLIGATVVGDWEESDNLNLAVKETWRLSRSDVHGFIRKGFLKALKELPGIHTWPAQAIVCNCTQTTVGRLRNAIQEGFGTVDALQRATGAATVCGSCRPLLNQLVDPNNREAMESSQSKENPILWLSACLALLIVSLFILLPPLPVPDSVRTGYYQFSQLWKNTLAKQITGYSLAGVSSLALLLSARKRMNWFHLGTHGFWRMAHALLGAACMLGIVLHTGLNLGENLNLWLMICFLGLNFMGALTALTLAVDRRFSGPTGRRFRHWLTHAHILFFWPYPVLLGFHIVKVYLY